MADGIIGYPFDSILTFDEQGNPTYDRAVSSKVLKTLISKLFTTGVMPNPSNNLLVTAGTEGMTTVVEKGFCVIEGGLKLIVEPQTMMHQASDTNYDRIDTVVMRWDNNDNVRHCGLFVVAGTPATSPVRPTLTREGSIYEIGLADVLIKANSTVISANRITDTRYDDERCGVVRSISEYDTTYIYQQVQADLAEFKNVNEAEFTEWFETIRGILDEDVAGHLQNEIDDLRLNGGNSNLAPVESGNTATVATQNGKYVVVGGVLYKALSNIAIGDTYVSSGAGANIERKLVGDELAGINQNLTNLKLTVPIYNEEDDYFYVNGMKWQKGYFQRTTWFNAAIGYNQAVFGDLLLKSYSGNGAWYGGSVNKQPTYVNFAHALTPSYSDAGYTAQNTAMFRSESPINVTNFTKMVITGNVASYASGIYLEKVSDGTLTTLWGGGDATWRNLEIPFQIEGEYRLVFHVACRGTGKSTVYANMTITELYFE